MAHFNTSKFNIPNLKKSLICPAELKLFQHILMTKNVPHGNLWSIKKSVTLYIYIFLKICTMTSPFCCVRNVLGPCSFPLAALFFLFVLFYSYFIRAKFVTECFCFGLLGHPAFKRNLKSTSSV